MSAHDLLLLLNELRKSDQMGGLPSILSLFLQCVLIYSILEEHECYRILFIISMKSHFWQKKS